VCGVGGDGDGGWGGALSLSSFFSLPTRGSRIPLPFCLLLLRTYFDVTRHLGLLAACFLLYPLQDIIAYCYCLFTNINKSIMVYFAALLRNYYYYYCWRLLLRCYIAQ